MSDTTAHDEPELVQLLTPDGELVTHPDYPLEVDADQARSLYRDLVLVRRVDTEAVALQRQGELGLWASLLGQEAAQIGSGRALRDGDMAFPSYREHGVAWCRGIAPRELLGMFRGVTNGGWDPAEHGFQLYTIVIGSQALHATGYAMGVQRDGAVGDDGEAVIAYFGDGATSQGDTNEAFNFAAVNNAPVVFFCQNNRWALSVPNDRQVAGGSVAARAQGYGMPGTAVDGNDAAAVHRATAQALERARSGQGPSLIEALTYRVEPHSTSDDTSRYRDAGEERAWRDRDPLTLLRARMEADGSGDPAFFEQAAHEARERAEAVRDGVAAAPEPEGTDLFAHVFREPTEELARQQRVWHEEVRP